ncbi:MAG: UDP-3-O-(3-hydroxymyristoyl)glucosamine N-acyltransferase [Candidatus Omnitrophica bacterium]|nr:UDP-3-O-(3-hydroxymyristoyl)glucosamine N-acyltransferase [Candidatus Omnitrophota bacterium]
MIPLKQLAALVKGEIVGNADKIIKNIARPDLCQENYMTFAFTQDDLESIKNTQAECVVTTLDVKEYSKTILKVKDIKFSVTAIYNILESVRVVEKGEIHSTAVISKKASLGNNISIGANVVIEEGARTGKDVVIKAGTYIGENVVIGNNVFLNPNVTIYANTVIGSNVIIHSGSVIGADGFGYMPVGGKTYKVPQLGKVVIGNNVEIGANACVDRGTFSDTVLGDGVKIDNFVQVAHNVKIENNVLIAALVGIGGSTIIGENTLIGGCAAFADHIKVGKNARIGGKTAVIGHVNEGQVVFGNPYRDAKESKRLSGVLSLILKHSWEFRKFVKTLKKDEEQS